jgi:hypothetical protein
VHTSQIEDFNHLIATYIDNSEHGAKFKGSALWPLIKRVKVFCNSDILKNGLVLVDLPGVGDKNKDRSKIAGEYLAKLDHIWVVAPIVRAVDDQTAKELLGKAFRAKLKRNRMSNHVTFVLTKTDDINVREAKTSLNLDQSLQGIEQKRQRQSTDLELCKKSLAEVKSKLKDYKETQQGSGSHSVPRGTEPTQCTNTGTLSGKKRKHEETEDVSPCNADGRLEKGKDDTKKLINKQKALERRIAMLEDSLRQSRGKVKQLCIQQRNEYVKIRFLKDFEEGFLDDVRAEITAEAKQKAGQSIARELKKEKAELEDEIGMLYPSTYGL